MDSEKRKSTQFLVPDHISETPKGTYDIYPGFSVAENAIQTGYTGLADFIEIHKTVMIDGYVGVFWDDLRQGLDREFKARGIDVLWHDVSHALKDSDVIDGLIEPYLGGDDPLFGKRAVLDLDDFFNTEGLVSLARDPSVNINILFGTGAGLCAWEVPLVYVDVPKNEIQFRMRAGSITNLGAKKAGPHKSMYKRFYFVDWVILNRHKQQLVSKIDVLVDDQRPKKPFWTTGECLRNSLVQMSENVFRVRPWFEPGPWGGTWIKENIDGLSKDVPNYAWSFELIVPENGLLLEDQGKVLEFSFDFLMFQEYKNVLGEAADFFGYEFPIRFDYLDTFDGGNLSIQVHPKQEYFVREFGEGFTQDECYYILDTKENADVYLGFREGVDGQRFREALERSARKATPLNMDNYVQAIKAKKHDLFLIPGGTVHGSGKNNLVLEISATPYIFTFKLYLRSVHT
ncbi:MAG: class I mannose-6-phosphate isomerase, partial [Bacteroidota bacterium]